MEKLILPLIHEEPNEVSIASIQLEGLAFEGEDYSDEEIVSTPKPRLSKNLESIDMLDVISKKKGSKEHLRIIPSRSDVSKLNTINLGIVQSSISPLEVKKSIKVHSSLVSRLLQKFREEDEKEYEGFMKHQVFDKKVEKTFHRFYLLHKKYAEQSLIYMLNSYDETGLCRLFQDFYLEFDQNNDRKMQINELEKCIEYLAREDFLGKKKVINVLKEIGVDCENKISFFEEFNANKLLNDESLNELFKALKVKSASKQINPDLDYVEFSKFAPLIVVFFLEYMAINFLKKREIYYAYLGYPRKINRVGKAELIEYGNISGLYRIFVKQLKGQSNINEPLVSYRDISQGLISYRSSGVSTFLTNDAIERIANQFKEIMSVDPVTLVEAKKRSMREILPNIACKVITEITWNKGNFPTAIMKYDKMVEWYGCAYCKKINRKKLHRELDDAFSYLRFPSLSQFVKGLNYILKKLIPTLNSPVAIIIAKKISKTPNTVIREDGLNGEIEIKFDIEEIVKTDDLFKRLYYYSIKTQIKMMFVRLLYKNFYSGFKTDKGTENTISRFREIMNTPDLFKGMSPGKFGDFENSALQMLKIIDPRDAELEEGQRQELKKKKCIEKLIENHLLIEERKQLKKNPVVKKSNSKISEKKTDPKLQKKTRKLFLQSEANQIDMKIEKIKHSKEAKEKNIRVSSAFPNDEKVTPGILMSIIENSKNQSKDIKELRDYIYQNNENTSYQDIHKFIISKHLKKSGSKDHELIQKSNTKYLSKNMSEEILNYNTQKIMARTLSPGLREKTFKNGDLNGSIIEGASEGEDNFYFELTKEDFDSRNCAADETDRFEEYYFRDVYSKNKKDEITRLQKLSTAFRKDQECDCRCDCYCIIS